MRPQPTVRLPIVSALALLLLSTAARATVITLDVPQHVQHRDTEYVWCEICQNHGPHHQFDAPIPPWGNGCPHCAAYSVPAAIMMIHDFRQLPGCPCCQECFYNRYKYLDGEIPDDFFFTTHGIGFWEEEVLAAFRDALGGLYLFREHAADPSVYPMTAWRLRQLIAMDTPVLWSDKDGYPVEYMPPEVVQELVARDQGHLKVLAGYDDMDTYCMTDDDLVLVYDPWPSPPGCPYPESPYWVSVNEIVAAETNDYFLVDRFGGTIIAESEQPLGGTSWSNARHLVRDESDGSYNSLYASAGQIYFSKSFRPWQPGSWSEPVRVSLGELPLFAQDPALAIGSNPQGYSPLYAVWVQAMMYGDPPDLYYSVSLDGGRTWSFPENVYNSPFEDSRHPSLDIDGRGTIHLVWDETGLEGGPEIYYSTLGPDGDQWSPPANISRSGYLISSFPALATSYDGTEFGMPVDEPARMVHVAWVERTHPPMEYSTVVYRSWDPDIGWSPSLDFPPEDVTMEIGGTSPSIVAGPDRIPKIVWTSCQDDPSLIPVTPSDVYYSEREGGFWQIPQRVSLADDPLATASVCPTIAYANGPYCFCLHAAWEEWYPEGAMGVVTVAMRSGMTMQWEAHTVVSLPTPDIRRFPSLAYKNGTEFSKGFDLVWTDPTDFFSHFVRFLGTSRPNADAAAADEPSVSNDISGIRAWPNPFRDRIEFSGAITGRPVLQIFDLSGRRIRELLAPEAATARWFWDGRDAKGRRMPQGIYLVRRPGTTRDAKRIVLMR
jgi:hypothetical protein